MPLYEYHCKDCDGVFELLRPIREAAEMQPCPVCDRDAARIMPTDFAAYVMRSGMPRKIPDQGLYWTLQGQSTEPHKGQSMDDLIVAPAQPNPETARGTLGANAAPAHLVKRRNGAPIPKAKAAKTAAPKTKATKAAKAKPAKAAAKKAATNKAKPAARKRTR